MTWRWFGAFSVLLLCSSLAATAASLSGSLETTLALDPSALGVGDALLPDTLSSLTLQAAFDYLSLKSLAIFDLDGLIYLSFGAEGESESLAWNSALVFSPLGDTRWKLKTTTEQVHWYDWSREYFVNALVAENVNSTSSWYVRVSADNTTWRTVTGTFDSTVHTSGPVPVDLLVRYVEVRATTGVLQSSTASPEKLTITYSNQIWKTNFTIPAESLTIFGTLAIPIAGKAYVFLAATSQQDSALALTASIKLGLQRPSFQLCFEQAVLEADLSIGCIEGVTARIELDDTGFDSFSLSSEEIPTGLSWLTFSGELTFTVLSKEIELEPEIALDAGPCFTLYAKAVTSSVATEIDAISLYGIGMGYAWNGLEVSSLSYLDGAHYIPVLGSQSCWEALTIASSADSCCGGLTELKCSVCFAESSGSLFDWAETDLVFALGLSETASLSVSMAVETLGFTYLAITFLLEW